MFSMYTYYQLYFWWAGVSVISFTQIGFLDAKQQMTKNTFYRGYFTLPSGHFPNTFCFISPSICFISPTNLLHFPNKLLRFPNKMLHFPNKLLHFPNHFLISPTQFCVTLPKNKIIKIQTSAHKNPDICSLNFGNLTVVMEMMVFDNEAHVEVNQDKEVTKVVE